jgi:hypothetical protein
MPSELPHSFHRRASRAADRRTSLCFAKHHRRLRALARVRQILPSKRIVSGRPASSASTTSIGEKYEFLHLERLRPRPSMAGRSAIRVIVRDHELEVSAELQRDRS